MKASGGDKHTLFIAIKPQVLNGYTTKNTGWNFQRQAMSYWLNGECKAVA